MELPWLISIAVSLQKILYTGGPGKFCHSLWAAAWYVRLTGVIGSGNVNEVLDAAKSKCLACLVVL